jgi:hypothetical protein
MERNFNEDHFEQFLRDSVEDFRMTPSRRVWTSLYNNLHPGRRWPSLAVSLLVFSALIFVGLSNTSQQKANTSANKPAGLLAAQQYEGNNTSKPLHSLLTNEFAAAKPIGEPTATDNAFSGINEPVGNNIQSATNHNAYTQPTQPAATTTPAINNRFARNQRSRRTSQSARTRLTVAQGIAETAETTSEVIGDAARTNSLATTTQTALQPKQDGILSYVTNDDNLPLTNTETNHQPGISTENLVNATALNTKEAEKNEQKAWMDQDVFYNKKSSLHKQKLSFEVYMTPSVGYRKLENMVDLENASINLSNSFLNTSSKANKIHHLPAFNMEAGYSVRYEINKILRIKGGFQLNYSNYQVYGQGLDHPAATSLLLRNSSTGAPELISRSSVILNPVSTDQTGKLNNSNFQISLPIGAEIKLLGKNKWQWYAGATIQPTYVLSGNAYLLSADMNYYVFDASMINKWNINTGVETFVSYKMNQKLQLNMGPQFRYQLHSTYDKQYTYKEKLYNLGIKLGIVQRF